MNFTNAFHIARLEVRLSLRDREAVFWSLLAPIAMAWLFGSLFGSSTVPSPTRVAIEGGVNPPWVTTAARELFQARNVVVVDTSNASTPRVVLPDSLIQNLTTGNAVSARIEKRKTSDRRATELSVVARQVLYTLALRSRPGWRKSPPDSAALAALVAPGPLRVTTRVPADAPRRVGGVTRQLAAMLVMFVMFQMMTFFMTLWVEDIKSGKIRRIVMSPTRPRDLFVGMLASRLVWGTLQIGVIVGMGPLVLRVPFSLPPLAFAAVIVAYMISAVSLGMVVATFFDSIEKANAAGVTIGLVLAALGGCWWPLEVVPPAMRHVAMVLPTGITMDAIEEMFVRGSNAPFPAAAVALLLGMSAVMMPIAIRRMRRQIVI